jgi:hypothetical protein
MTSSATAAGAAAATDYDGRCFRPVGTMSALDGSGGPLGRYHQDGDVIWAEFSGPEVRIGRLVGTRRPDGTIDAAYCMIAANGEAITGTCVSTPTAVADGTVRLTERWRRPDGSAGITELEEVTG